MRDTREGSRAWESRGVRETGVVATIKHFAAANLFGSDLNHFPKQQVDEQTLHETYCRPFEAAVKEGGAGSIMNAYNDVNGSFVSANKELLTGILREQWGFKGSVMSDWGSVHQFTLDRGMDMEMPFPAFNAPGRIEKRLKDGRLSMKTVDEAVRHILYGMSTAGLLSLVQLDETGEVMEEPGRIRPIEMEWYYEEAVQSGMLEKHEEAAAQIVREGTVLLKNENHALPLREGKNTVLIGLGARYPICGEAQERSFGRLSRMLSGQEALEELTGREFSACAGVDYAGRTIPAEFFFQDKDFEEPGLIRSYGILEEDIPLGRTESAGGGGAAFEGEKVLDEDGEEIDTGLDSYNSAKADSPADVLPGTFCCVDEQIDFTCGTDPGTGKIRKEYRNGVNGTAFGTEESYTWKGYLKVPEDGEYSLILGCIGGEASFYIDTEDGWKRPGQSQMREWAQWPWESIVCTPEGMGITSDKVVLKAGQPYRILLQTRQCVRNKDLQLRLAWLTPSQKKKDLEEAARAAGQADTIVFFACDSSIGARASEKRLTENRLEISEEQTSLLQMVIRNKQPQAKLVVIMQTANARAIGEWEKDADAVVAAYMPGQEGSRVLARILTGNINPSGKLTQTWPARPADTPLTDTCEHQAERRDGIEEDGNTWIHMTEGIFTGYRWYDKTGVKPLFPFGHGLSYTTFSYSDLVLSEDGTIRFRITNTGQRTGDEVAQLYLGDAKAPAHIQMAEKQLADYRRVKDLKPGESREVEMQIDPALCCYWDPDSDFQERDDGTRDKWVRAKGVRRIYIGASSKDIRLEGEMEF